MRCLLADGHQVRVLCRSNSPSYHIDSLSIETVYGDLRDTASLQQAVAGCDALFHVAADYRLWTPDPASMYEVNVDGSENLFREALRAGVQQMVYTSSVATIGLHRDGTPADETTSASLSEMTGHYKRSKYLAEERVRSLVAQENAPIVIVNPAAPVGPGDLRPTPTGKTILDAVRGRMPAYMDTGLNVVHVDDVATGHLLAMRSGVPGERYILGSENMTLKQILEQIATLTGRRAPKICLPFGCVLPVAYLSEYWAKVTGTIPAIPVEGVRLAKRKMFFSSDRARSELGYRPRPAREAISAAVNWFSSAAFNQASG